MRHEMTRRNATAREVAAASNNTTSRSNNNNGRRSRNAGTIILCVIVICAFCVILNASFTSHLLQASISTSTSASMVSMASFGSADPCATAAANDGHSAQVHQEQLQRKPRLLYCGGGYALNRNFRPVLRSVFADYEWIDLTASVSSAAQGNKRKQNQPTVHDQALVGWNQTKYYDHVESHPFDIFITNWKMDECQQKGGGMVATKIMQWLHLYFRGKIVFLNPEDGLNMDVPLERPHFYELGPQSTATGRRNHMTMTFLQAAFWAQVPMPDKQSIFLTSGLPPQREEHGDERARKLLIYAHSNCVEVRETAFHRIAQLNLGTAYYGGRCQGNRRSTSATDASPLSATVAIERYDNTVKLKNWEDNRHIFREFKFCLTMEHASAPGYITEKILVAFWAGCIPIYFGPKDQIIEIFNENAFVYYDPKHPEVALQRIRNIAMDPAEYDKVSRASILADGAAEKFFSFDETVANGKLREKIRQFLELPP